MHQVRRSGVAVAGDGAPTDGSS